VNAQKKWFCVTACENIPLREGRLAVLGGRQIAIFNLGDRFLAIENRCPHRGGPLVEGIVSGTTVVCPLHAWKIGLETGSVANPESPVACVITYPARVMDGVVQLQLPLIAGPEKLEAEPCVHRDRPIRWVQRKPPASNSGASSVF